MTTRLTRSVAIVGVLSAIFSTADAGAAQKWLRCALTEYSGNGGNAPFGSISPNVRFVVFDDSPASFAEYLGGQLSPGSRIEIDADRIVGHAGIDHFSINRTTGVIEVYRGVGSELAGVFRGRCEATTPLSVVPRKF